MLGLYLLSLFWQPEASVQATPIIFHTCLEFSGVNVPFFWGFSFNTHSRLSYCCTKRCLVFCVCVFSLDFSLTIGGFWTSNIHKIIFHTFLEFSGENVPCFKLIFLLKFSFWAGKRPPWLALPVALQKTRQTVKRKSETLSKCCIQALTRLQLSGTNSLFLSAILPLSALLNLPWKSFSF